MISVEEFTTWTPPRSIYELVQTYGLPLRVRKVVQPTVNVKVGDELQVVAKVEDSGFYRVKTNRGATHNLNGNLRRYEAVDVDK